MRFPTMWYVRPAKAQTSLRTRAVWSEPLLVAWLFYDSWLLTEHHLEFISIKVSSESPPVKIPHCWTSHVSAHIQSCDIIAHFSSASLYKVCLWMTHWIPPHPGSYLLNHFYLSSNICQILSSYILLYLRSLPTRYVHVYMWNIIAVGSAVLKLCPAYPRTGTTKGIWTIKQYENRLKPIYAW